MHTAATSMVLPDDGRGQLGPHPVCREGRQQCASFCCDKLRNVLHHSPQQAGYQAGSSSVCRERRSSLASQTDAGRPGHPTPTRSHSFQTQFCGFWNSEGNGLGLCLRELTEEITLESSMAAEHSSLIQACLQHLHLISPTESEGSVSCRRRTSGCLSYE